MSETVTLPGAAILPSASGSLLLLGVNHTTAPLDVRERLAIPPARLREATRALAHQPGVREALILSTCNRVELLVAHDVHGAVHGPAGAQPPAEPRQSPAVGPVPAVGGFLHDYFALPPAALTPHLYQYREREAIRHLFRVASSLDSMVVGEPQILGQVKQCWTVAREVGAIGSTGGLGSVLDPLLQRAFSVAKRVRTETRIGSSAVSVASVTAELARKIFGSLSGKTVLIVGAGKMSDLAARHLIAQGATTLLVSNRTEERAQHIADILRTPAVTTGVVPFAELHAQAYRADIIISSTGAAATLGSGPGGAHVFTREQAKAVLHQRRNRPVFFIDMAVPRDVAPEVNKLEGCFVYDMDDLQQVAAEHQGLRSREAAAAERIVAAETERYNSRLAQAPATAAIRDLQVSAEALRQAEMARTAQRLAGQPLTPEQQAAVDALTRSLTAKLLHPQLSALRETAKRLPPE